MVTKISAIIEAYLQRENRLIIPNVGTLLKRKESGEIVFVEMLKKNDGKLEALVAAQFGVAAEEAAAIVEGYVEEIGRQITASRKFIIDGVGVLLVGANGALDFAFNPFSHTIPEPQGPQYNQYPQYGAPQQEQNVAQQYQQAQSVEQSYPREVRGTLSYGDTPNTYQAEFGEDGSSRVQFVVGLGDDESDSNDAGKATAKPLPDATQVRNAASASSRKQSALYDDDDEEEAPTEAPRKMNIRRPASRKKVDPITIIAIVAVVLAMITLLWGAFSNNSDDLELDTTEQYEMGSDFLLEEN